MHVSDEVFQLLKANRQSLSIAESCTGGGLANEISKYPGVSDIFFGSVTAYRNLAKEQILSIPHEIIARYGAVSEQVALLMAKNCQTLFSSTWSLSTTGIAGPTGATPDKPIGLVWIGLASPHEAFAQRFNFEGVSRLEHRQKTIEHALNMLKLALAAV